MHSNLFKFIASAPTRVDIAGGTIDLWPIHNLLTEKATVNVAVALPATVTVTSSTSHFSITSQDQALEVSGSFQDVLTNPKLQLLSLILGHVWDQELPPIHITTSAKSPAGAGLGGSSCLSVTAIKALLAAKAHLTKIPDRTSEEDIVRTAQDIESLVIHAPTGVQDYWGAVRGGLNILSYPFGSTQIQTMRGQPWESNHLKIICCYSGKSRASAINNWEIFKRLFDRDTQLLARIKEIGVESKICADAIKNNQWTDALAASKREWKLRCQLWPNIETPETKAIDVAAQKAGAMFTRVCGAGGGGVMAAFCTHEEFHAVTEAMTKAGGQILDAALGVPGLQVKQID
jgi:D-glycero-alpha-D-manno-heptose-7-phosphate kinase